MKFKFSFFFLSLNAIIGFLFLSSLANAEIKLTDRVLVIQNQNSPISVEIATDYMKKRHVRNVIMVQCPDSAISAANETMKFALFQQTIEKPLQEYLSIHKNIDFIVLTKGIPLRLTDAPIGLGGNRPSLDSYLACLDYAARKDTIKIPINRAGIKGILWHNRFWNASVPFSHARFGGYLVTRLDGYTIADVKGLVVHAIAAEKTHLRGLFLLDTHSGNDVGDLTAVPRSVLRVDGSGKGSIRGITYKDYNTDQAAACVALAKRGFEAIINEKDSFVGSYKSLAGYSSWGSNDPKYDVKTYDNLRFVPGAISETAVSTSARTFLPTNGGQSLIADLVHNGITGIKGYCDEPLLTAVASPYILFDRYTRGWTLAESFYAASRVVGWEDIVIGDPICRAYRNGK